MNDKSYGQTLEHMKKSGERYAVIQGYFQRVCEAAVQLAENKQSTLKGLTAQVNP